MSEAPELLPCPFCGGEAELQFPECDLERSDGTVMCMSCYIVGETKPRWQDAVVAWNTRSLVVSPGIYSLPGSKKRVMLGREVWVPEAQLRAAVERALEMAAEAALDKQGRRTMGSGHGNASYDVGISDATSAIRAIPVEDVLEGLE